MILKVLELNPKGFGVKVFFIVTGHAFKALVDILFFESWLNNNKKKI